MFAVGRPKVVELAAGGPCVEVLRATPEGEGGGEGYERVSRRVRVRANYTVVLGYIVVL